jgi:succinyl-diaminopimelate desuccinylase
MSTTVDSLALAQALIRCRSVTPADGGALSLLAAQLSALGFACHPLRFAAPGTPEIDNLYARWGSGPPNFCFAGHTDVVPPGDDAAWASGPFAAEVRDGRLYGRGAADMKSAIAAFVGAAADFIDGSAGGFQGAISLLITGDEEGPAVNGTTRVLDWMEENGERIDACVVGEPTNPERLGDMIKIGRRGSMNVRLTVHGSQGHTAYPHLADNPLNRLVAMLMPLTAGTLDEGSAHFQASTVALSSIDVGNKATNVIPAKAEARFNIRFNDLQTFASIEAWLRGHFDKAGGRYELDCDRSSVSFLTQPGPLVEAVAGAAEAVLGRRPELSTTGGTSDARFIRRMCPVVEFGLVGQTMHKTDENVRVADIATLRDIYRAMLERYFHA